MAFNPFNAFRKHQKVWFAMLTIVCMFVFILTGFGGKADPVSNLLAYFAGRHTGEKVVTLYGRDLYTNDLTAISKSRQLANEFMFTALSAAQTDATKDLDDYKPEKPDDIDARLKLIAEERFQRFSKATTPQQLVQIAQDGLTEIDALRHLSATTDNTRRNRAIEDLGLLYRFQYFEMMEPANRFYFGGGVKTEELLNFEIWKHQADKLGVVLTKADTRRAVADQAAGYALPNDPGGSWKDEPVFKEWFAGRTRQNGTAVPEDVVVKAVQDEFRVMIAQQLMAGHSTGIPGLAEVEHNPPDLVTPYDFWKFYRDYRTTIKAAFLPVPVESMLDQVPSQPPSEQSLKDLFAEYKSAEPNPALSTPGFKDPHRIKIEYVVASPTADYYKNRGLAAVLDPSIYYLTSTLGAYLAGGGVAPQAALAGIADKDALASDYNFYLGSGSDWISPTGKIAPYDLHDQTFNRPEVAAAAVGQAFGAGMGGVSPLSIPSGTLGTVFAREAVDRERVLASTFLTVTGWSANLSPFAGFALQAPFVPAMPPASVAMRQLFEKRQQQVLKDEPQFFPGQPSAPGIVSRDLEDFTKELDKIKNKPEAEVQEFIKKTAKERGWEVHDNAGLDDIYTIGDDPALRDVKFAIELFQQRQNRDPRQALPPFDKVIFDGFPPGTYVPSKPLPDGLDKYLVFWRSMDERARELSYEAARPRVLEAWRLLEARKLALRKAEQINNGLTEKEANGQLSPPEAIKFFRDKKLGEVFELANIARLIPIPTVNPGVSDAYTPYMVPASKIPNAPADLLDQLLALEKPGQSLVFQDQPEKTWYVAVLEERPILSFDDRNKDKGFLQLYADASDPQKNQFWRQYFEDKRQKEFEAKLMRQLREEAGRVDANGQLILDSKPKQLNSTEEE